MTTPVTTPPGEPDGSARPPDVHAYVGDVRARLDDLTADEIEELTGGLEADLAEALSGSRDTPWERYGDPAGYADELRSAAGLPPRSQAARGERVTRSLARSARDVLAQQPWWAPTLDFLHLLRPTWWVLRGVVAVKIVLYVLGGFPISWGPSGPVELLLLVPAVFASVQLGRRSVLTPAQRRLVIGGNVVAVAAVLLVPVLGAGAFPSAEPLAGPSTGLLLDGERVVNVFPYDSQGRPLTDVRLYDDRGRPLITVEEWETFAAADGSEWQLVPREGVPGPVRNAFPLLRQPTSLPGEPGTVPAPAERVDAPLPYATLAPLTAPPPDARGPEPTSGPPATPPEPAPTLAPAPAASPSAIAPTPTASP